MYLAILISTVLIWILAVKVLGKQKGTLLVVTVTLIGLVIYTVATAFGNIGILLLLVLFFISLLIA